MALTEDFNSAVAQSKELPSRPSNEDLLQLYALFKQATDGDVSGDRPGGFDFKAIAKFDAWSEKKGTAKDAAMQQYARAGGFRSTKEAALDALKKKILPGGAIGAGFAGGEWIAKKLLEAAGGK